MSYTYIIIDDDPQSILKAQAIAERFRNLSFVGAAQNYEDGLNLILEHQPNLVFLEIDPINPSSNLSIALINELYRYLKVVPKIIVITKEKLLAYEALQHEVIDYLLKPLSINDFRKAILKLERNNPTANSIQTSFEITTTPKLFEVIEEQTIKSNPVESNIIKKEEEIQQEEEVIVEENIPNESNTIENEISEVEEDEEPSQEITIEQPEVHKKPQTLIICIKSYGDYRYIDSTDILYFEADNNSTDIHLNNGEMITAFKTLKHFENVLPKNQFLRIHNSYIINIEQVSRIHTGNTVCYIKNSATKLPFSKSYKENVDLIISLIAAGNYLEI